MPAKKAPAKKAPAKKPAAKLAAKKPTPIRPAKSRGKKSDGVAMFSMQGEMLSLLQRVSGNKSKRTLTALVNDGPLRAFLVAMDTGASLEGEAVEGNVSVQCLFGSAQINVGRLKKPLNIGDLAVLEAGIGVKDIEAVDPCVLLVTVAAGEN